MKSTVGVKNILVLFVGNATHTGRPSSTRSATQRVFVAADNVIKLIAYEVQQACEIMIAFGLSIDSRPGLPKHRPGTTRRICGRKGKWITKSLIDRISTCLLLVVALRSTWVMFPKGFQRRLFSSFPYSGNANEVNDKAVSNMMV